MERPCIILQPCQECEPQWTLSNATLPYKAMCKNTASCRCNAVAMLCRLRLRSWLVMRDPKEPCDRLGRAGPGHRAVMSVCETCFDVPVGSGSVIAGRVLAGSPVQSSRPVGRKCLENVRRSAVLCYAKHITPPVERESLHVFPCESRGYQMSLD